MFINYVLGGAGKIEGGSKIFGGASWGGSKIFGGTSWGGSKIFGPWKLHSLFTHTGKFILDSIAKTTFQSPFCDTLKQGSQLRCNWLTALAIAIFSFLQDLLMEGWRKSA